MIAYIGARAVGFPLDPAVKNGDVRVPSVCHCPVESAVPRTEVCFFSWGNQRAFLGKEGPNLIRMTVHWRVDLISPVVAENHHVCPFDQGLIISHVAAFCTLGIEILAKILEPVPG